MSAKCVIDAKSLLTALWDINDVTPKGTKAVPVLFDLSGTNLNVYCSTGCLYRCALPVSNPDNLVGSVTVLYQKITDFIDSTETTTVSFEQYGLHLESQSVSLTLPIAFSSVTAEEPPEVRYTKIGNSLYSQNLSDLLNLSLASLYAVDRSVEIAESVAYLRYPNVQVKVRTDGLAFRAAITAEHVKLMLRFNPTEYYCNNVDTLILKRTNATLQLPVKPIADQGSFEKLQSYVDNPIRMSWAAYINQLRSMSKLGKKLRCKVTALENGIATETTSDNVTISVVTGDGGEVKKVFMLPLDLWLSLAKPFSKSQMEFLYGEELICLRNPYMIILLRASV